MPRTVSERVERKAAYVATGEAVSLWQDTVKANRERPTLKFTDAEREKAPRIKTLASMNAGFDPGGDGASDFERAIMAKIKESGLENGRDVERAEELRLNALSAEEAGERRARLAKMRNLLFRHELKAKRVKAIKSKTFARHNRKTGAVRMIDGDGKTSTRRRRRSRAWSRRTPPRRAASICARGTYASKHKNTSRWAKRAIRKGLAHLPGTRRPSPNSSGSGRSSSARSASAARALTARAPTTRTREVPRRTPRTPRTTTTTRGEDAERGAHGRRRRAPRLARAKTKTLRMLQDGEKTLENASGEEEGGLFALPFMAKALRKKREAAENEARALLEDIERAEAEARGATPTTAAIRVREAERGDATCVQDATWGRHRGRSARTRTRTPPSRRTRGGRSGARTKKPSGRGAGGDRGAKRRKRRTNSRMRLTTPRRMTKPTPRSTETKRRRGAARAAARAPPPAPPAPPRRLVRRVRRRRLGGGEPLWRGVSRAPAARARRRRGTPRARAAARASWLSARTRSARTPNPRERTLRRRRRRPWAANPTTRKTPRGRLARARSRATTWSPRSTPRRRPRWRLSSPRRRPQSVRPAGAGGRRSRQRGRRPSGRWRRRRRRRAKRRRRQSARDAKLARVVTERFDKKAARFNVEHLPHGFESKAVRGVHARAPGRRRQHGQELPRPDASEGA